MIREDEDQSDRGGYKVPEVVPVPLQPASRQGTTLPSTRPANCLFISGTEAWIVGQKTQSAKKKNQTTLLFCANQPVSFSARPATRIYRDISSNITARSGSRGIKIRGRDESANGCVRPSLATTRTKDLRNVRWKFMNNKASSPGSRECTNFFFDKITFIHKVTFTNNRLIFFFLLSSVFLSCDYDGPIIQHFCQDFQYRLLNSCHFY